LKLLEAKGLDRVLAVKVNGENRDLYSSLEEKTELEPIDADSPRAGNLAAQHFPRYGHGRERYFSRRQGDHRSGHRKRFLL